jgi:hypothetical protein
MAKTQTVTKQKDKNQSQSQTQGQSQSQNLTQNVLDNELLNQILSGLMGPMTDEQIQQFAEGLLRPQLNAGLEASQQQFDATRLAKEQEIANLANSLQQAVGQQQAAYNQSMANIETGALSRGMGRSSYTMQTMANQGNALAEAVRQLTDENARQTQQIQDQITLAQQQHAQTQGRLNTDYAANLAAKVQELQQAQRDRYNSDYMTALSLAMQQRQTGTQTDNQTTTQNNEGESESETIVDNNYGADTTTPPPGGNNNNGGNQTQNPPPNNNMDYTTQTQTQKKNQQGNNRSQKFMQS